MNYKRRKPRRRDPIRCDDCGRFAKPDDLQNREPWLGGVRHRRGVGCYPFSTYWTRKEEERAVRHGEWLDEMYEAAGDMLLLDDEVLEQSTWTDHMGRP